MGSKEKKKACSGSECSSESQRNSRMAKARKRSPDSGAVGVKKAQKKRARSPKKLAKRRHSSPKDREPKKTSKRGPSRSGRSVERKSRRKEAKSRKGKKSPSVDAPKKVHRCANDSSDSNTESSSDSASNTSLCSLECKRSVEEVMVTPRTSHWKRARKGKSIRSSECDSTDSHRPETSKRVEDRKKSKTDNDARKRAAQVAAEAELEYESADGQDAEADQPEDFRQELKGRVADLLRMHFDAEREPRVMALEDQLSAATRVCERMRAQMAHTSAALDEANARADIASSTTQLTRGKLRTFAAAAAKMKQSSLRRLEKRDVRIKFLEAAIASRDIQIEALGVARECLLRTVARLKHARPDEDAVDEDERDAEVALEGPVSLPHRTGSPGASLLRRRTGSDVLKNGRGRGNIVFAEGDALNVPFTIVSFRTARLWVVRAGSRVVCDSCARSVPTAQGFLLSDSGRSRFMQERFLCAGCLMTAGAEVSSVSKVQEVQASPVIEPPKKGEMPKELPREAAAVAAAIAAAA